MDNETITAHQIGYTYMINSSTFAKRYKDTLSDFETWGQKEHASEWILLPQNIGNEHGIDETSLQGEPYTIVHNKDAHGRKGAIIAVVKGTNPTDVLRVLMQLPEDKRKMVESITMDLSDCMRAIAREAFPQATVIRNKKLTKETAKEKLGEWYEKVAACPLREIKSVRDTIKFYEDEILNYFIERQTNASAESLNSKIKCFRAQVKGVRDIPFFMYRLATVLG